MKSGSKPCCVHAAHVQQGLNPRCIMEKTVPSTCNNPPPPPQPLGVVLEEGFTPLSTNSARQRKLHSRCIHASREGLTMSNPRRRKLHEPWPFQATEAFIPYPALQSEAIRGFYPAGTTVPQAKRLVGELPDQCNRMNLMHYKIPVYDEEKNSAPVPTAGGGGGRSRGVILGVLLLAMIRQC